jgi:hypothetical protein
MNMDRETSDKIATMASHIMHGGNPLDDDAFVDTIVRNVLDAATTGTQDQAREAIREPLRTFMATAKSLAASCVSQADGRE